MNRQSRRKALDKLGSDIVYLFVRCNPSYGGAHADPAEFVNIVEYNSNFCLSVNRAFGSPLQSIYVPDAYQNGANPALPVEDVLEWIKKDGFSTTVALAIQLNAEEVPYSLENLKSLIEMVNWQRASMASFQWGITEHKTTWTFDYAFLASVAQGFDEAYGSWVSINSARDGSGEMGFKSESVIQETDSDMYDDPYLVLFKRILRQWKIWSQRMSFEEKEPTIPYYTKYVDTRFMLETKAEEWINEHKFNVDGVDYVYPKDFYEACGYSYTVYGEPVGNDEVNKTDTVVNTLEWSDNNYGKGLCIDYKQEDGVTVPYINSFANNVAAQLYLTTQLHSYSEASNNKVDTNWSDTTFGSDKNYDFLASYDVQESLTTKQGVTSIVPTNNYWNQKIYPFVNKPTGDNTSYMMMGKKVADDASQVYCFDNSNTLKNSIETSEWVEILADDTKTTRAGVWNNNGVQVQKQDYEITAGKIKFPTYKIKEEQRSIYDLCSSSLTGLANEKVGVGSGILCGTVKGDRPSSKINMTFKVYNESGTEVSDTVHWKLSNKMFDKCELASGATLLGEGNSQSGTLVTSPEFASSGNESQVWLTAYADTDGYIVKVDSLTVS